MKLHVSAGNDRCATIGNTGGSAGFPKEIAGCIKVTAAAHIQCAAHCHCAGNREIVAAIQGNARTSLDGQVAAGCGGVDDRFVGHVGDCDVD